MIRGPAPLSRRAVLAGGAVALAAPGLSRAAAPARVTLWGPPAGVSVTLIHAVATGALPDADFRAWRNIDELRAGLTSRTMDLVVTHLPAAATLRAKGLGVRLVNVMTEGLLQMLAVDPAIDGIAALRGRRVAAIHRNELPDHVLRTLLARAGLAEDAVAVDYVGAPMEAAQALLAGRADAAFVSEPAATAAVLRSQGGPAPLRRAFDVQAEWGRLTGLAPAIPQAGLAASAAFAETQAERVERVAAALEASAVAVNADPAAAARLAAPLLELPEPVLAASIPHARLVATRARAARPLIEPMLAALAARDPRTIGGRMPDDGFYL
jgi:NitT/TauT family transport system substrate-binding protein